ncbi:MAG: hypothetical protein ACOVQX_00095 [Legionella sp.]
MPIFTNKMLSYLQKIITELFFSYLTKHEKDLKNQEKWSDVVVSGLEAAVEGMNNINALDDSMKECIAQNCIMNAGRLLEENETDINKLVTSFDKELGKQLEYLEQQEESSESSPRP